MAQSTQDSQLRDIAQRAREAAQADRCTIFELAPDRHEVFSRVALGLEEGLEIRLPTTRGVIGFVARTGRPLRLRDAYNDPRFDPSTDERTGYRTKSILCVPVTDDSGAVLGAIQLINKVSGTFSQEDEDVANGFCADVARIIQS